MRKRVALCIDKPGLRETVEQAGFTIASDAWIVLGTAGLRPELSILVAIVDDRQSGERAVQDGAELALVWPDDLPLVRQVLLSAHQMAESLRQNVAYRDVFRNSPVWQELTDEEVVLLDVSDGFVELAGWTRDDAVGATPASLFRGETHGVAYYEQIGHQIESVGQWRGDLLGRRRDGSLAVMDACIGSVMRQGVCIAQYAVKVEAGKRKEGSLRSWIAERVESPWVLLRREDGCIVETTPGSVLGLYRSELLGKTLEELGLPIVLPLPKESTKMDVWRQGVAWQVRAEGRLIGDMEFVLVELDDVTERKEEAENQEALLRQLADARDEARAADRAKSAFLAAMSHDLRTPLNAILGYGELVLEDSHSEQQKEDVRRILTSGEHLLGLVDQVLDLARIESGEVELVVERVDPRALLEEVANTVRLRASRRNQDLQIVCAEVDVWSDRQRLLQILTNLATNAVKYAVPGVIVLGFDGRAFFVEDEGPGLSKDQQCEIFEPFRRLARTGDGVGLGLALCARLASLLGGGLIVDSDLGRGSRFELSLARSEV